MKISAGKIIYFALVVLLIFLTVKGFNQSNGASEVAEKMVVLENSEVVEENEGKLVLVTGKITPKDTLKFEEYQIEVQSPVLERKVEMYQYVQDVDEDDRDIVKKMWSDDFPEEEVYDDVKKENYNNPNMRVESETLYGEAYLGKFLLDKEVTKKLRTNETYTNLKDVSDFKVVDGNTLTNVQEDTTKIGDLKLQFTYLDLEKAGDYTILGKQSGDKIVEYKLDKGLSLLKVLEGIKTKEDVLEQISKERKMGAYGPLVALVVLLLLGFLSLRRSIKQSSDKITSTIDSIKEQVSGNDE